MVSTTAMVSSTTEATDGVALVAAAAALLPIPAEQSQICAPIFTADIDSAEKGKIATTIVPLEMKRSPAPKTSEVPAPPIDQAAKRAGQTTALRTVVKHHTEIHTAVDEVIEEFADREASGGK